MWRAHTCLQPCCCAAARRPSKRHQACRPAGARARGAGRTAARCSCAGTRPGPATSPPLRRRPGPWRRRARPACSRRWQWLHTQTLVCMATSIVHAADAPCQPRTGCAQPCACCGRGGCTRSWRTVQAHRLRAWRGRWPGARPLSAPLRLVSLGGRSSGTWCAARTAVQRRSDVGGQGAAQLRAVHEDGLFMTLKSTPERCPDRALRFTCGSALRPRCRTTPSRRSGSAWREAARTAVHARPDKCDAGAAQLLAMHFRIALTVLCGSAASMCLSM
jgi:hypothetical protein